MKYLSTGRLLSFALAMLVGCGDEDGASTNRETEAPSIQLLDTEFQGDPRDGQVVIRWFATDPDSDALVSLAWSDTPTSSGSTPIVGALPEEEGEGTFLWDASAMPPGEYWIVARVSDGEKEASALSAEPVEITANVPPTLRLVSVDLLSEVPGSVFHIRWESQDPDDEASIALRVQEIGADSPPTLIANGIPERDGEGSYRWDATAMNPGTYRLQASVDDGRGSAQDSFEPITVFAPPPETVRIGTELLQTDILFGGTIVRVENPADGILQFLKLSSTQPVNSLFLVDGEEVVLYGCESQCSASSPFEPLMRLPNIGVEESVEVELNALAELTQTASIYDGYDVVSTAAVLVSEKPAELVFDTIAELRSQDDRTRSTRVRARWYALPERAGDFQVREAIPAIGYFDTDRASEPKIARWRLAEPIHYYIKGVPPEYRDAVAAGFDLWNELAKPIVGLDLFTYEFLNLGDPRFEEILAGDVRVNVFEWEDDDRAFYLGFGPTVENQRTGEIISAAVLIQGRTFVETTGALFEGTTEPESTELNFADSTGTGLFEFTAQKPCFSLGSSHHLEPPSDVDLEGYRFGALRHVVAHELGHNLGLRHNFKGSLDGEADAQPSSSVMEYVGGHERHLQRLGAYDESAIRYGYLGDEPIADLAYCTDSDSVRSDGFTVFNDPECNLRDASSDPYTYLLQDELLYHVDELLGLGSGAVGAFESHETSIFRALEGLVAYGVGVSYPRTSFFTGERPVEGLEWGVDEYVIADLTSVGCNPVLFQHLESLFVTDPEQAELGADYLEWVQGFVTGYLDAAGWPPLPCSVFDLSFR